MSALKKTTAIISLVFVSSFALISYAVTPKSVDDIIKERQNLMKTFGQSGRQLNELIGKDNQAALLILESLQKTSKLLPNYFPQDTGNPPYQTTASPTIWKNWDDFVASANIFTAEIDKITAFLQAGNVAAAQEQLGNLSKVGCGTCHSKFRLSKR